MIPPQEALDVDFAALAIADPDFAKIYTANDGYVDFQNPETVQQLTKSILKRYFSLKIELLGDRLCPPVPVRYEYIRWLQDLVDTTSDTYTEDYTSSRVVVGIDIGVGASCIYPLLGCASRTSWRFGGTDVDEKSLQCATANVALNDLQSRIRLRKVDSQGPLLNLKALGIQHADFTMCNPPFFASKQEMLATHLTKKRSPSAVCSGADVEMITEGGDLGFVLRIVEESLELRGQVQWYSSMLGKLASVHAIVGKLKEVGITNWAVTTLQAGNITKRWAVAWSFDELRPRMDVARRNMHTKELLSFPAEFNISVRTEDFLRAQADMLKTLEKLKIHWDWDDERKSGLAFAMENVWSRSARRKQQRETLAGELPKESQKEDMLENDDEGAALGIRITSDSSTHEIRIRWLKGTDSVLFESFCGMLKKIVT